MTGCFTEAIRDSRILNSTKLSIPENIAGDNLSPFHPPFFFALSGLLTHCPIILP
jgi:hypothetical protein